MRTCASEIWEARKKGRPGNKRPAMNLGERAGNKARGNARELPNSTFMIVIPREPNCTNDQTPSMQLQASYSDVRHREALIDFIEQNCSPQEPYCLNAIYTWNMMREESHDEYMGSYAPGQMRNDPLYVQISYNSSLSNAFKLKLGHDVKLYLVEMKAATGQDIAEHVIRPVKVIPASLLAVSYAPLPIRILRLGREPMKMTEWWMWRQVGKRLIVVLM